MAQVVLYVRIVIDIGGGTMNLSVATAKAQMFFEERNQPVYIAKAEKQEDYMILFDPTMLTPHFHLHAIVDKSDKR